MDRTKIQKIINCLFGGRRKVRVTKICVVLDLCRGVLLRTRSAHRLSLQHLAAVPTPNITELVPSVFFFVRSHGFCGGPNTFFQNKHPPVYLDRAAMNQHSYMY